MNLKRYTGRTSSEALAQVRQELGEDAVVLSTKPGPNGVEVLAMAPDGLQQIEAAGAQAPLATPSAAAHQNPQAAPQAAAPAGSLRSRARSLAERIAARGERLDPTLDLAPAEPVHSSAPARSAAPAPVEQDVKTLGMSTLTFQDYVRERMTRRAGGAAEPREQRPPEPVQPEPLHELFAGDDEPQRASVAMNPADYRPPHPAQHEQDPYGYHPAPQASPAQPRQHRVDERLAADADEMLNPSLRVLSPARTSAEPVRHQLLREPPVLREELPLNDGPRGMPRRTVHHALPGLRDVSAPAVDAPASTPRRAALAAVNSPRMNDEMLDELRSVRSLIEERFGMLAFMDKLQKNPAQVALGQQLFDMGLSPGMVRKLVQALPEHASDGLAWAAQVLEANLMTNEAEAALEDHEGVFALIGPTGVGKTTSTAKLAAAFAAKHGAHNLGLITLDAYRVGAHEQLRTYGRILGVPVHTAHDRASLEDLLELLASKRMVLIDTAGMAQRDSRTRELLEMLSHPAIRKLLVVNAAAQGETVEDVMVGYRVHTCEGVILSKLDEAVKLGPALDALIRHTARVVGVANGQRVPEDWHRLSAQALVQRALHGGGTASWRFNANEVSLVFAATQGAVPGAATLHAASHAFAPAGLHA